MIEDLLLKMKRLCNSKFNTHVAKPKTILKHTETEENRTKTHTKTDEEINKYFGPAPKIKFYG